MWVTFLANPSQIPKFLGHLWVWLIQFHMLPMVTTIVVPSVYLDKSVKLLYPLED